MKKYCIIGKTDGYIASRDARFRGKTEIYIERGLSLKEARKRLLDMYNKDYETSFSNWGLAVLSRWRKVFCAWPTFKDGTRGYSYDSRMFYIEEDVND